MHHKCLVLPVKKLLKSVHIYGSYRKKETGVPFLLEHPVCDTTELIDVNITNKVWNVLYSDWLCAFSITTFFASRCPFVWS